MIYVYTGTPASGKTLHAVREVLNQDKRNFPTIINFEINVDALRYPENVYFPKGAIKPEHLINFSRWYCAARGYSRPNEGEILLVIDEAQTVFNSRAWNEAGRKEWITFFSQHRKYGFDIILITQNIEMLDKQIRALVEYNVVHRSVKYFIGNKMLHFFLKLFMGTFQVSVFWYHTKMKVTSYRIRSYKKCYAVYDTFRTFQDEEVRKLGKLPWTWETL